MSNPLLNIPAQINIGRVNCNDGPDYIRLEIYCATSGSFVRANLDLVSFAKALTGQGFCNAKASWYGLDRVGRFRQAETYLIPHEDLGEAFHQCNEKAKKKRINEAVRKHSCWNDWRICNYGFETQQPFGGKHKVILERYTEDPPAALKDCPLMPQS